MIVWYHKLLHLQNTLILLRVYGTVTHGMVWFTNVYHYTQYLNIVQSGNF